MTYNGTTHAQLRRYAPHSATATTRGRRRVKTSPFTCHCKNTSECVTSCFLHLIGGAALLFHWQRKVASSIQTDSSLSAMKHLLLQPTPRRDVDSLNQCWQTALVQPFFCAKKKKAHETPISVSIILIFWQRRAAVLHRVAQGHFITCQHTPGTR